MKTVRLRAFCLLLPLVFCLTACDMSTPIQAIKLELEPTDSLELMICWAENTAMGSQLRRIVNNYNLTVRKEQRISLRFYDSEIAYLTELRAMTATGTLPSLFILIRNDQDSFLQQSNKLMELSGACPDEPETKCLVYDERRYGLYLARGTVDLRLHSDEYSALTAGTTLADAIGGIGRAASVLLQDHSLEFDIDEWIDSGEALDYFVMLLQANGAPIGGKSEVLSALTLWKASMPLFGEVLERTLDDVRRQDVLNVVSYFPGLEKAMEGKSLLALTGGRGAFAGCEYYLAASKQSHRSLDTQALSAIRFIYDEMSALRPNDDGRTGERLLTRCLSAKDWHDMNEYLRLFGKELMNEEECADMLTRLLEPKG